MTDSNEDFLSQDFSDEAVQDNSYIDANIANDMEEWFNNNRHSPINYRLNVFKSTGGKELAGVIKYHLGEVFDCDSNIMPVYLCAATIKSCPYVLAVQEVEPDPERKYIPELVIYGHCEDFDDEFTSRIDEHLMRKIDGGVSTKFQYVRLYGAFESISSMSDVVEYVYKNLLENSIYSRLRIQLDSKVKNDDGEVKTLANLINSCYINKNINPKYTVEYVYKHFDPRMTAKLYTRKYVLKETKLFEENDSK